MLPLSKKKMFDLLCRTLVEKHLLTEDECSYDDVTGIAFAYLLLTLNHTSTQTAISEAIDHIFGKAK